MSPNFIDIKGADQYFLASQSARLLGGVLAGCQSTKPMQSPEPSPVESPDQMASDLQETTEQATSAIPVTNAPVEMVEEAARFERPAEGSFGVFPDWHGGFRK